MAARSSESANRSSINRILHRMKSRTYYVTLSLTSQYESKSVPVVRYVSSFTSVARLGTLCSCAEQSGSAAPYMPPLQCRVTVAVKCSRTESFDDTTLTTPPNYQLSRPHPMRSSGHTFDRLTSFDRCCYSCAPVNCAKMKAPLADTSSTFQVQSVSTSTHDYTAPPNVATRHSLSFHPSHPSPVFHSPAHPHPALPYLYDPEQHYMKKPAEAIGYSRHAQLSHNMHLSLGWDAQGALKQWEKEKPFAVREQREREDRRRRGEAEEPRQTFDLWSACPPLVRSVPAGPADYSIHANNPITPATSVASQPPASLPLSASSATRQQAAALLAAGSAYDPYAAIANPFFTSAPSNYTAIYADSPQPQSSPLLATTHKPNLTAHSSDSYRLPFSAAQPSKRRNNRWTEERLFFRGYSTNGSDEASGAMAVRPQQGRDLLFEQPLYSSFTLDGVYREPQRRKGAKKQRWVKVETPRMRLRQPECEEKQQSDMAADGVEADQWTGEDGGGQPHSSESGAEKVEVRLSGVFVPRVSSRFIPSTSLPLCKPRWD